jgi:alkaline phosphatase D
MWITCWLVVVCVMGAGPAAAQSAPTLTRIAFGSCAHQERPQPIWEAVLQYRPELFLFLVQDHETYFAIGSSSSQL